ncbi:PREDICTED: dystroglycan-like isoform X2 [Habropoda laboriosa]|uniref:dystroglycan-like isoform X2 n=1 Tax=Habropoda laboriosa TaxID=597456 RepID=UPI00083DF91B|nr:PREDICTED: dystroglycan-like isoform X2 [Habropoda laboriosa]
MKNPYVLACFLLLLPSVLGLALQEDDLVFDDVGEENTGSTAATVISCEEPPRRVSWHDQKRPLEPKRYQLDRLRDIPRVVVPVGHLLKLKVDREMFSGPEDYFELFDPNRNKLLRWLYWKDSESTLLGIPTKKDIGSHLLSVKVMGKHDDTAKDLFVVQVVPEKHEELKHKDGKTHCSKGEEQTLLTILLSTRFDNLMPCTRVNAIENLASFLGLHVSAFSIHPQSAKENLNADSSVLLSGPGNVKHRKDKKHLTAIQWQVGCDGHLWRHQTDLVKHLREQAKDGTLAEVMQLPVLLWRVTTESSLLVRNRREVGSGDYGNPDDYGGYDEYDDEYEDGEEYGEDGDDSTAQPTIIPETNSARGNAGVEQHPHRHHHGEGQIDWNTEESGSVIPDVNQANVLESGTNKTSTDATTIPVEQSSVSSTKQSTTLLPITVPANATNTSTITTLVMNTITPPTTTTQMRIIPTTTTTTTTTTTMAPTTINATSTTTTTTPTTISTTTELPRVTVETGISNFPPKQDRRLKKIPVTAGKPLSYIIPSNTFSDFEDGDTRNLRLSLYLQGAPLKTSHWLQFNQKTQEVYGLPLENDISTWNYELVAADSEGLNVTDRLDIHVQQHKLSRSVNHEFSIYLRLDKRTEFPTDVDWQLKVIRSLSELYGDSDTRHITVRTVDIDRDQAIFTWTNDSLPRSSECPKEYINDLLHVLMDRSGDPSSALREVLQPEMRVKRVVYQGIGQCEDMTHPELPKVSTQEPKSNYPPLPRNQVDLVNASVGQLLVFKVPEDTFYDVEDGSARNMQMSLLTTERKPIPPQEWLQFDSKNQEFYGVPMHRDVGRKEYQLVVTDKEGASATDGLVVVVHPAPFMVNTVEFSMTLDIPYESFAHSALQKRNFIEKLRDLYQDKDTNAISLYNISNGSTVITWHNRTLPTLYCANDEVARLRSVLVKSDNDRRSVTDEVLEIMGPKFPVKQITVIPMGICVGELTNVHSPDNHAPPVDDSTAVGAFHDDYLLTFVLPAVIVIVMIILTGIVACVLHRRKRSGKMSVSDQDDERQSFRSKGIPVIFQDELDEKPDPGNKSPVILKEEKPPLPPPEYQKAEDGADVPMLPKENSEEPYQPPPPFATNRDTNRQNRPKPTPTYRKPPPYVPP